MKVTKKLLAALLCAALLLSLSACAKDGDESSSSSSQVQVEKPAVSETALVVDSLGMAVDLPKPLHDRLGTLLFPTTTGPMAAEGAIINGAFRCEYQSNAVYQRILELQSQGEEYLSDEEYETLSKQSWTLFAIFNINGRTLTDTTDLTKVTGFDTNTKIGEVGDASYYLAYNAEADTTQLDAEDTELYAQLAAEITNVPAGFSAYSPIIAQTGIAAGTSLEEMDATDFAGNQQTVDLFKGKKLTLVNVWATNCPPCINEMPELERISQDYADRGVQVIGICADTDGTANMDMAKEIISKTKVTYNNLIPDDFIYNKLFINLNATPTTFFVDENGVIVGSIIKGSRDYKGFSSLIDAQLEAMK